MRKAIAVVLSVAVVGFGSGVVRGQAPPAAVAEIGSGPSLHIEADGAGVISGSVRNGGAQAVREVRLLIRHAWLWKNERNPGPASQNPGRAAFFVVDGEVPAGGELRFRYVPDPPLPSRTDGSFKTTAEVVGFVEVEPPSF